MKLDEGMWELLGLSTWSLLIAVVCYHAGAYRGTISLENQRATLQSIHAASELGFEYGKHSNSETNLHKKIEQIFNRK